MATYYWRGGSGQWDTSTTTNWSTTSGGAGGAGPPTSADDVIFNSASSGGSYVVTCVGGVCNNITTAAPAAGTLTFNAFSSSYLFWAAYGNINVHAACLFTVGGVTTVSAGMAQYVSGTSSCTFNSSGTNTRVITFQAIPSFNGVIYTFCNSSTQTFNAVFLSQVSFNRFSTVTCTNSTISFVNLAGAGSSDYFNIDVQTTITVTGSTFNFGVAAQNRDYHYMEWDFVSNSGAVVGAPNVVQLSSYNYTYIQAKASNGNLTANFSLGTFTAALNIDGRIKGWKAAGAISRPSGATGGLSFYSNGAADTFTCTSVATDLYFPSTYPGIGSGLGSFSCSGAYTGSFDGYGLSVGNITIGGTLTLPAGKSFYDAYFSGGGLTLTLAAITANGTEGSPCNFNSYHGGGNTVNVSGNVSLSYTNIAGVSMTLTTTNTFTSNSAAPVSSIPTFTSFRLSNNGGAVSITNANWSSGGYRSGATRPTTWSFNNSGTAIYGTLNLDSSSEILLAAAGSTLTLNGINGTATTAKVSAVTTNITNTAWNVTTGGSAFGALTVSGGSLTGPPTASLASATTITTTNATISFDYVDLTATGAVSFTGDVAGTKYVQINALIGSSTVSFTNLYSITILASNYLSPTHALKGTTLTVNNSGLTSPNTTGSTFTISGNPNQLPTTFTGLATFNNVAATIQAFGVTAPFTSVGLTLVKGTYTATGVSFTADSSVTHSIGAVTATSGGTIAAASGILISSGAITATNVTFDCGQAGWTAAGTVAISSSPTSATNTASFNYFINGAFTTTFTSYDVSFVSTSPSGPSAGAGFYSTGNLVVDLSGRASAGTFYALSGGTVVFVTGAGATTWSKVIVDVGGLTATGAGGLVLTSNSTSDQAGFNSSGNVSITGPLTLTNLKNSGGNDAFVCVGLNVGGAFIANNSPTAGANTWVRLTSATITGSTTFTKVGLFCSGNYASTGTFSATGEGSANSNKDNTFTVGGTLSSSAGITVADYYNVQLNAVSGTAVALTHASQIVYATATGNVQNTVTVNPFTLTRVRLAGNNANTFVAGFLNMSASAAVYGFASLQASSTTSNAGSGNFSSISAGSISFLGNTVLTNTHLWANGYIGSGEITHNGGGVNSFSFTIDANAIPCDAFNLNQTSGATYPGISFKSFTLTNTPSCSCTSATVYKRPLISSDQSAAAASVFSIPLATVKTFTNVDFWRVVPGGTSAKPWTGTSLGRVGGTIPDLTTTAPKSVYYVGGAGSWQGAVWATSSGGTGSTANYPLPQDTINFDGNSGGGTVTIPASVRIGQLFLAGSSPGLTKLSPTSVSGTLTEIWLSAGVIGPSSLPAGGNYFFIGDNTTTGNYSVVLIDGGSTESNTITNGQYVVWAYGSSGGVQYGNAGTLNIPDDIGAISGIFGGFLPYGYYFSSITQGADAATRQVNITSSTFSLGQNPAIIANGTFNLGSCVISSASVTIPSNNTVAIPATAYTWNVRGSNGFSLNVAVKESIGGANAAHLGNLRFTGTVGSPFSSTFSSSVNDPTFLSIGLTESSASSGSLQFTSLGSTRRIYTLSTFNVTNSSGGSFSVTNSTGAAITLNGVVGARNQWTNVTIGSASSNARINALPATPATWYYSGGSLGAGQTGWNAGAAPVANNGFFFF